MYNSPSHQESFWRVMTRIKSEDAFHVRILSQPHNRDGGGFNSQNLTLWRRSSNGPSIDHHLDINCQIQGSNLDACLLISTKTMLSQRVVGRRHAVVLGSLQTECPISNIIVVCHCASIQLAYESFQPGE